MYGGSKLQGTHWGLSLNKHEQACQGRPNQQHFLMLPKPVAATPANVPPLKIQERKVMALNLLYPAQSFLTGNVSHAVYCGSHKDITVPILQVGSWDEGYRRYLPKDI